MTDDLEHRLEQWGSAPQPPVDGAFANRLDLDLRELRHLPSRERAQRPVWQPAMLALAAAVLVVAGVFAVSRDGDDEIALVMGPTTQTEVVLPGGEVVPGEAGLALPDGTRITVGDNGSTVIADVVLAPGTEAVIVDNRLEILVDEPSRETATTAATPSTTTGPTSTATTAPTTTAGRDTTTVGRDSTRPPSTTQRTTTTEAGTSTPGRDSTTTAATRPETSAPATTSDRTTTSARRD